MKFEYVGFRPVISQFGVSFKQGKDDKYIYLPYAYEILESVKGDFTSNKKHSMSVKIDSSNIDKLFKEVEAIIPTLEKDINEKLDNYKKHIENKYNEIESREHLNSIDKSIYLSNLDAMKDYRINRAKNKIFYYFAIAAIAELIKENKIKKLNLPFSEQFWHVLKTLQGVLSSQKVNANIVTEESNNGFVLSFTTNLS